tara:strand:- start:255 stop:1007 length:753 start_codon:yes stop_codon:yes gene_type:complete
MKKFMRAALLLLLALLGACNSFSKHRFASFDKATALPQTHIACPVIGHQEIPDELPSSSVYLRVNGDFAGGTATAQALGLKKHVTEELGLRPDFMIYAPGASVYAGSTSQYVGLGMSMSTPHYRPQGSAWCFRIAPAQAGISFEDNGFVNGLSDDARKSGILEGDTLVSLDGKSVKARNQAPAAWNTQKLFVAIGQEVEVIWIRPGTGRMSGRLVMQENKTMPEYGTSLDQREVAERNRRSSTQRTRSGW